MNNTDHELKLLGCIKASVSVIDELNLKAHLFTGKQKLVYTKMIELRDRNIDIDDIVLFDALPDIGIDYLNQIHAITGNAKYYHDILLEAYRKRQLVLLGETAKGAETSEEILEKIELVLQSMNQSEREIVKIGECLHDVIDYIQKVHESKGDLFGIHTGYRRLNEILGGFVAEELTVIGARPGTGKTAFMLCLANNMSKQGHRVGLFSLEMGRNALVQRFIASVGRIDMNGVSKGMLTQEGMGRIVDASTQLHGREIYIDDTPNIGLTDLKARCRKMARDGIEIIFIDYLSLIQYRTKDVPRHERVGHICKVLKGLARELQIPIVVLSQLRRDTDNRRPTLSDLAYSGEIEQDADNVIFLYREEQDDEQQLDDIEIIIAKHRAGPVGHFKLVFNKKIVTFESWK